MTIIVHKIIQLIYIIVYGLNASILFTVDVERNFLIRRLKNGLLHFQRRRGAGVVWGEATRRFALV